MLVRKNPLLLLLIPALLLGCGGRTEVSSTSTSTSEKEVSNPSVEDSPSASTATLFTDVTEEWGIRFTHRTGAGGALLFPEMMGGGVAVFDADQDGDLDLYFISGAPNLGRRPKSEGPVNRLYLQGDDGSFTDATEGSGLGDGGYGTGVGVGDVNNDGFEDVYVANFGPDRPFLGIGGGTFEDVSTSSGIHPNWGPVNPAEDWSSSVAFCDIDRDGFLDLYVTRYVIYDPEVECTDKAGRREYCGPNSFEDRIDLLLRGRGDGTFEDISRKAGIHQVTGAALGVVCEDMDDDGWMDFYVANDGDPNQLWVNQKNGTFIDDALIMGTSVNSSGLYEAGMGVVAADFDGDTDYDLFVTHLRDETNTFYRNLGPGVGFEDQTNQVGLSWASTPYTGFGIAPLDMDLDGDLDIVVANGRVKRGDPLTDTLKEPWNFYGEPNLVYANEGGSFRLLDQEAEAFTGLIDVSRAVAIGDLDGDGVLDMVVSHIESPTRVYRGQASRHWLLVDAIDPRLNRRALGARITLEAGGKRQVRTIQGAMSYLSSSDPRAHFGLGSLDLVDSIRVRWPDGLEETFSGGKVDRVVVLQRGEGNS